MLLVWVCTSTCYYIGNFYLKYLKGDIFINTTISAFAETGSLVLAGGIYLNFGLKKALLICYFICAIGSVFTALFENSLVNWIPVFVLFSKFGVGAAFGLIYVANFIFPVEIASQTLGFCNTTARLFTMVAPLVAELDPPVPMIAMTSCAVIAGLAQQQLEVSLRSTKE